MPEQLARVDEAADEWLSLTEAARRLGVHPTTLRRWADAGQIPVMLTPGGHRRFALSDIDRFADARRRLHSAAGLEQHWAQQALNRSRQEIAIHQGAHWLQASGDEEREYQRALGRRLMGLILKFASQKEPGTLLEEARVVGDEYARSNSRMGLTVTEALEAFLVFRDALTEAALQMQETTAVRPETNTRLLQRINTVLNTVQLAMVKCYDGLGKR